MEFSEEFMRDYLLGKTEADQVDEFEKAMAANPKLRVSLEETRDLMIGIKLAQDEALRKRLRQIDETQGNDEAKIINITSRSKWIWAIAAVVLIAATSIFLYINGNPNQALYQAYFMDYPNIISPGQRDESNQSSAFLAYQNGQWQEAIDAFDKIKSQQSDAAYPDFYGALASMHLRSPKDAIPRLKSVIKKDDPRFTDAAGWYLALAYLGSGKAELAIQHLQKLADGDSNFQQDAENLLRELK